MVDETGDDSVGDDNPGSSVSDCRAPSSEAAKLLDISGSDTTAYEDCVEVVDIEEVVRSRPDNREACGSNCQRLLVTSTRFLPNSVASEPGAVVLMALGEDASRIAVAMGSEWATAPVASLTNSFMNPGSSLR